MLSDREISLALNLQISIYLHRRHQHPHCDDSCEIQSLGDGTRSALIRCRSKWHRPTRWAHCPVQNVHFVVLTGPCHNPAVCTPPEHQPDPSGHHTPSPTVHGGRSLLCQSRSCFLHWPGGPVPRLLCCCPLLLFQGCLMCAKQRWCKVWERWMSWIRCGWWNCGVWSWLNWKKNISEPTRQQQPAPPSILMWKTSFLLSLTKRLCFHTCLYVCCKQDYSETTKQISTKLGGRMWYGSRKKHLQLKLI